VGARNDFKIWAPRDRFWSKVRQAGSTDCWLWLGKIERNGYGRFWYNGRCVFAHRFAYEDAKGPIPEGLSIDHLCRNRGCVNPSHLEAVTNRVNLLRGEGITAQLAAKTHCTKGHPFDLLNTAINRRGARVCIQCRRERGRRLIALYGRLRRPHGTPTG